MMWRLALAVAMIPAGTSAAGPGLVAAECAALYEGHHLYEQRHFDAADLSAGWRDMAQDFRDAARSQGASDAQIEQAMGRSSGWAKAIEAHIMGSDPTDAARYEAQQVACDGLVNNLPGLRRHR